MATLTRRFAVRSLAVGAALALAGCIDGGGPGDGSNGDPGYDVYQFGGTTSPPDWSEGSDATGTVELYRTRDRADRRIAALAEGSEVPGDARSFVEATDFGASVLVYVATQGPDTCYDEIEVRELATSGSTLTGTVAAIDTSEEGQGCGDAITYSAALVRVTADPRPDRAELTVVTGWGGESPVEATAEG